MPEADSATGRDAMRGAPGSVGAHWAALASRLFRHADSIMAGVVLLALAFKFLLAFRINVHWDEFYFLSFVHEYARGALALRHQTFHAHLFSWLPSIDGEIQQVIAARLVMAVLATGSACLIYGIARRFAARGGALFAVLGYLSLSVVVEHGASFRSDPILTFLVLASLFALLRWPGRSIAAAIAGAALGLAALVTIKAAMFLPVVALMTWCQLPRFREQARVAAAAGIACALAFGALYLFHASSLAQVPTDGTATFLQRTAAKVLIGGGFFARWADLALIIGFNPLFWIMAAEGAIAGWRTARGTGQRADWLPLVVALPVLTPLIYRNAFTYFFPLILAPAAVLVALFYEKHRAAAQGVRRGPEITVIAAFLIVQCSLLAVHVWRNLPDETGPQRSVLAAVHAVFPEPVPYIDGYAVVASFPRHGFLMSSWGMETYHAAGQPVFPAMVEAAQPPLLLADSPSLYGTLVPGLTLKSERQLLPADVAFLKDTYVPHWGMLFVAGKQLRAADGAQEFEIAIAGAYRLESPAPASIDDERVPPGGIVQLAVGTHTFDAGSDAILRWAKALPPPAEEPVGLLPFFGVD